MRTGHACTDSRWLVVVAALGFAKVGCAGGAVSLERIKIADGIYQFASGDDGYVPNGNSVVVINQADVLVFDTFTRPSTASAELAEIRKITDKPVRYVVNSHWHPDHWSGNQVYAREYPHLEIIATEETRQFMLNTGKAWVPVFRREAEEDQAALERELRSGKSADGAAVTAAGLRKDEDEMRVERDFVAEAATVERTYPTLTYSDKLTLHQGGREFDFFSMAGDARGTTVLYLPNEKILMTGDVVSYPIPYYTPPLSEHAKTLRALAQFDANVIIPGHGPAWHDKDYLNLEAELFETIGTQVLAALRNGAITVKDVQAVVHLDLLRPKFTHNENDLNKQFNDSVNGMIENAYREAHDGQTFTN